LKSSPKIGRTFARSTGSKEVHSYSYFSLIVMFNFLILLCFAFAADEVPWYNPSILASPTVGEDVRTINETGICVV